MMATDEKQSDEELADVRRLRRRRRWIVLATLSAILLFVFVGISSRVQVRRYVADLQQRGAWVEEAEPIGPEWLPFLFGQGSVDFFAGSVTEIHSGTAKLSDRDLKTISRYFSPVELSLRDNPISNDGLAHISMLVELELLDLSSTNVTDAGLPHLYRLRNLKELYLTNTNITKAALNTLRAELPDCTIYGPNLRPVHPPNVPAQPNPQPLGGVPTRVSMNV